MSGIVRKIDDLGRIVIPKELRKILNFKNNDDIEIKIVDNKIILEKYYRLKSLESEMEIYVSILERWVSSDFLITDKEKIIFCSKNLKDKMQDIKISPLFSKMIDDRKQVLENSIKPFKINNSSTINECYYFSPLIINTDALGSIVLFNKNAINEKDITIIDIMIQFLTIRLEF